MSQEELPPNGTGYTPSERTSRDPDETAPDASLTQRAFLAHVRQELSPPLFSIIGYSEILLDNPADLGRAEWVPDLQRIHRSGEKLLALVNEVLDPMNAEDSVEFDLQGFGARIRHQLRTPLTAIIGYSEMLIDDAARLETERCLPELQRIRAGGEKLLALIDDILQLARGEAVTTELDQQPSRISPLARDVVSTIRPLGLGDAHTRAAEYGRVLIVDDNEVNRDLLSRRLARDGYTVATAENGRQALEMIKERAGDPLGNSFDLVLLDIMMPGMNGYQVLQYLKADGTLRHIPVIMISALNDIDSIVRCIELGAEDYLSKPFNPVLLKARIGACLEKKRFRDREVLYLQQIEEEKKRSDELLHVILPHEIVEEIKATNHVEPRLQQNVAVLFCDIVSFTPYCERRHPREVVASLQEMVEAYEELGLQHGLEKIKTIGDAFMATAGLLKLLENPVLSAVRCGLDMISTARQLTAHWEVRVGIHVGPVIAGVVGQRQYLFDLWGDTVNTAARVESHGIDGAVNVSRKAWDCVSGSCRGESLGMVPLKGKGEVEVFRVDALL